MLPKRVPPVPRSLTTKATVSGIPKARYWLPEDIDLLIADALEGVRREQKHLPSSEQHGELPPANYLAISGGGDTGAFGAGLVAGWSETGSRPEFKLVTGISTGALIAPFAFLGPGYDEVLRAVYTRIGPQDIYRSRQWHAAVLQDSLRDSTPLWTLIARHVTEELLDCIGMEYEKGRFLLIGTTDLDSLRPVLWNMGAIAASRSSTALELFRRILLASAAIPGLFPPVMIDVEAEGSSYQEMHVDGGATAQVFMFPPSLGRVAREIGRETVQYVRNIYKFYLAFRLIEQNRAKRAARSVDP